MARHTFSLVHQLAGRLNQSERTLSSFLSSLYSELFYLSRPPRGFFRREFFLVTQLAESFLYISALRWGRPILSFYSGLSADLIFVFSRGISLLIRQLTHTHTPELRPLPAHRACSRIPLLIRRPIINLQGSPTLSEVPPDTQLSARLFRLRLSLVSYLRLRFAYRACLSESLLFVLYQR